MKPAEATLVIIQCTSVRKGRVSTTCNMRTTPSKKSDAVMRRGAQDLRSYSIASGSVYARPNVRAIVTRGACIDTSGSDASALAERERPHAPACTGLPVVITHTLGAGVVVACVFTSASAASSTSDAARR